MIEQLREKYIWKDGFSDMAKSGEEGGQIGGGRSKGSSEIILGEIFFLIGSNTFSTHGRFQLYPILPTHILLRLWKWPSKSKYLFFRASFSQPTSRIKWVGEPDYSGSTCTYNSAQAAACTVKAAASDLWRA